MGKYKVAKDRKHIEFQGWEVGMIVDALSSKIKDLEYDRFNRMGSSPESYNMKIRQYAEILNRLEEHRPKVTISMRGPKYSL